jgi:hypothetical protein
MNRNAAYLMLASLALAGGCGGSADVNDNNSTAPALALAFVDSPIAGREGTVAQLRLTYTPGAAVGAHSQAIDYLDLTTAAPAGLFSFKAHLTAADFSGNVATVAVTLSQDVLQTGTFSFTASGEDEITRDIGPASANLQVNAASGGYAVFAPELAGGPAQDSVYLALSPSDLAGDNQLLLDVWFNGSGSGTCVRAVVFDLYYDDDPASGGTVSMAADPVAGPFPANGIFDFANRDDLKRLTFSLTTFGNPAPGCTTATAGTPRLVGTLSLAIESGAAIPFAFGNNVVRVDADNHELGNVTWYAGSADIQIP